MITPILKHTFLNNTVLEYSVSFGMFLLGIILITIFRKVFVHHLEKKSQKLKTNFHEFLVKSLKATLVPALYFGTILIALENLKLEQGIDKIISISGVAILTFFGIRFLLLLVNYVITSFWLTRTTDASKEKSIKALIPIVKIFIWVLGIVFLLDNLGFKISTLVAGLGIGGVAVALAAQAILGDLFSYFSILFDQPFALGDFIIVDEYMGVVEHIGIKTTRIRSLGGEQLIFSNTSLTNSRVRNYKRMEERRIVFKIGVTYQTSHENLKRIPGIIQETIESIQHTRFDRSNFSSFGDFSLDFETVYYIMSSDYNKYMNVQEAINLKLYEEFEKLNIEFAYPTQTLFLEKSSNQTTA